MKWAIEPFFSELSGIRPSDVLSFGVGVSREEAKDALLKRGIPFRAEAMTNLLEFAQRIIGQKEILSAFDQECLIRSLLDEKGIQELLPTLHLARNKTGFYQRIQRTLSQGRKAFASWEEESVYQERVQQYRASHPWAEEIRAFARAYESVLESRDLYDEIRVLRLAIDRIQSGEGFDLGTTQKIVHLTSVGLESLERTFLDELSRSIEVIVLSPSPEKIEAPIRQLDFQTIDDAAEWLIHQGELNSQSAVLIPDQPEIRRSFLRSARRAGWPLEDPRDPTALKWNEALKRVRLPLVLCASNFDRERVLEARKELFIDDEQVEEIHARGIYNGLNAYRGGLLEPVFERLQSLARSIPNYVDVESLVNRWTELLKDWCPYKEREFVRIQLEEFSQSIRQSGLFEGEKRHLSEWIKLWDDRIDRANPPAERVQVPGGLSLYRLSQAPIPEKFDGRLKLFVLGLPPRYLDGESVGDDWFHEREREILSTEFDVRSGIQQAEERKSNFLQWVSQAFEVNVLNARYSWQGKELESLTSFYVQLDISNPPSPYYLGGFLNWSGSFDVPEVLSDRMVELPWKQIPSRISASQLDRMSRCGFQSLMAYRWKARDVREASDEAWPDRKGMILHRAVELLMKARNEAGQWARSVDECLSQALKEIRPAGLVQSKRIRGLVERKYKRVLEIFIKKEEEYLLRSQAEVVSIEEPEALSYELLGIEIIGRADRIDRSPLGIWLMDYKAGGLLPHGDEMMESGYRIQLPIYALAYRRNQPGESVVGVQFVELSSTGGRSRGIFPQKFNGKEVQGFSNARKNSRSLVDQELDDIWVAQESHLARWTQKWLDGQFHSVPTVSSECDRCVYLDACGERRRRFVQDQLTG